MRAFESPWGHQTVFCNSLHFWTPSFGVLSLCPVSQIIFATFSDGLNKRDKTSLDIFWLRDESLEDADTLPAPALLAASIVEDLQVALEQFASIAEDVWLDESIGN